MVIVGYVLCLVRKLVRAWVMDGLWRTWARLRLLAVSRWVEGYVVVSVLVLVKGML